MIKSFEGRVPDSWAPASTACSTVIGLALCAAACSGGSERPRSVTLVQFTPYVYPLRTSATGRLLIDQKGRPFFLSGDAGWSLIGQLSDEDADTYLSSRAQYGFTMSMVSLIEHKYSANAPADWYGLPPFTGRPFASPNEAYFTHADRKIRAAGERGLVILLAPLYLGYACGDAGWCAEAKAATTAEMRAWGEYVGRRYRDFDNIVWLIGGDTDPTPVRDKVEAMVDGIRSVDTRHVMTAHNARGQLASTPWSSVTWLTLNNTYSNGTGRDYTMATEAYATTPVRPFFLIESRYEGEGANDQQLRAQSYWTVLGGGIGHIYGACPMWAFSSPTTEPCSPSNWRPQLVSQGAANMLNFRKLFESRHWSTLVPDLAHQVVTAGYGTAGQADFVAAAWAADSSSIIAYLPTSRAVTVNPVCLSGAAMTAWWYNPASGVPVMIGTSPTSTPGEFVPPRRGDWVLVLDGSNFTFSAPGAAPLVDSR